MFSDETHSNPILVEVYRQDVLESFHRGAVCVVDFQGDIVFSLGDPMQLCYPRSAMKLVQALPLVHLGGIEKFGFTLEEISVMCGSHNAEEEHLRVVNSILNKIGLPSSLLGCGAQYPTHKPAADDLIRNNLKPTALHNNCSGKHAGMLALCCLMGFPVEDYLNPTHPVQQLILNYVEEFYEYPREQMVCALDGCTAPIYSIPVYHQALCFTNLVNPLKFDEGKQQACKTIIDAISQHPFMVAGSNRYCSEMMAQYAPEIIGKTGAEGIFCMAFVHEKLGVCIKIDDGKMHPQYMVAEELIASSGKYSSEKMAPLAKYRRNELKNFNKLTTGFTQTNKSLFAPWNNYFLDTFTSKEEEK